MSLETGYGIRNLQPRQQRLVFLLAKQLLQSEDLAEVLTSVLGLSGDEIAKFADLLKRTSLSSMIVISELLVSRFQFIDELRELVYGASARSVKERRHLHKIVEGHTWMFGEQYHLMGSDSSLNTLLPIISACVRETKDPEAFISTDDQLRRHTRSLPNGNEMERGSQVSSASDRRNETALGTDCGRSCRPAKTLRVKDCSASDICPEHRESPVHVCIGVE